MRKIIQIIQQVDEKSQMIMYALCEDGSIWELWWDYVGEVNVKVWKKLEATVQNEEKEQPRAPKKYESKEPW